MAVWQYTEGAGYYYGHMANAANNSANIKNYLEAEGGFSHAAIVGIVANMDHESYLNPGQGEHGYNMSVRRGYGLVMWTPAEDKILAYAADHGVPWYDGDTQMDYLMISAPSSWIKSTAYPYTWAEYKQLTDYQLATKVFFYNFERGTWHSEIGDYADYWNAVLYGDTPIPPTPPDPPTPAEDDDCIWLAMFLNKLL